MNGTLLEPILLGVYQKKRDGKFKRVQSKEIGLFDFLKISNGPKYLLF